MDEVARKLQYKENFRCVVLDCPSNIHLSFVFDESRKEEKYDLEILFIDNLDKLQMKLPAYLASDDDRIRWIAYPKKSGAVASDINRDNIWTALNKLDCQPVSMISLDENWSVMRVRKSKYVRKKPLGKTGIPKELSTLLAANPECDDYFKSLSKTNQKEYIDWINSAKRDETRLRRLSKIRTLLRDKVSNPYASR